MHDALALVSSVGLPWIAGTLAVLAIARPDTPMRLPLATGYGYFVGMFAVTLLLRLLSVLGIAWSVGWVAAPLAVVALGCGYVSHRAGSFAGLLTREREVSSIARGLFSLLLLLAIVRAVMLLLEVLWMPLTPYDAWGQWASKAQIWWANRRLVPFVPPGQWLASGDPLRFTDLHYMYPGTVPLFQTWTGLCLGRWDESLVNLPWAAAFGAGGLAFYAQLRRLRITPIAAMIATYLLLSLPFLTIHVALAGLSDLFVAFSYGFAAIALWHWTLRREPVDAALAFVMAILCATCKIEGSLWALTLVAPVLVAWRPRFGFAVVGVGLAIAVMYFAFGPKNLDILGYTLRTRFENVSLPLYQHYFLMDNWHLLWYAALVIAIAGRRVLLGSLAPMSMNMLAALAFVSIVFFFSSASGGVDDETLINRLTLHMVPALFFYLVMVVERRWLRAPEPEPAAAPAFTPHVQAAD